jgi:hypothetical protein
MRALALVLGFALVIALTVLAPRLATAQPSALAFGQMSAGGGEEVGYRHRRYRYGYRQYYRPYYRPYAYYRPYYRPYYYPYCYQPYYYRPGPSFWFGF